MTKFRTIVLTLTVGWSCATFAQTPGTLKTLSSQSAERGVESSDAVDQAAPANENSPAGQSATEAPTPQWTFGGFLDAAYLQDFNYPTNHLFRSRGTTYKVDEPILNMEAAYLRKNAFDSSRWGMELTLQGGQDFRILRDRARSCRVRMAAASRAN